MIKLTSGETPPDSVPAEVRRFTDLVLAADQSYSTSRPWTQLSAMFSRWIRSSEGDFSAGFTVLEPEVGRIGNPVTLLGQVDVEAMAAERPPHDGEYFGVVVQCPIAIMTPSTDGTNPVRGRGWVAAAVLASGWRLLVRHADGQEPVYQLAAPQEAHELVYDLIPPLNKINAVLSGQSRR